MNHQLKYGYSQLGCNILVKINCKMSREQAIELEKKFPEICIWQTRNGYRIEGSFNTKINNVFAYQNFDNFKLSLALKMNDFKINKLIDKSQALLNQENMKLSVANLDEI